MIMDIESIASTLRAMLSQEDAYTCHGFFLQDDHYDASWMVRRAGLLNHEDLEMNRAFRETMVQWSYQVTDFVKFQRETVEFATSFFDRFLATRQAEQALRDRETFQLAFISCLYLATKLHEPTTMSPALFAILSKGKYSLPQMEKMEFTILSALQWRVNPPTALGFVKYFVALHPLSRIISPSSRDTIYDLAKVQIELILDDYRFVPIPRSTIALAALTNSLESLQVDRDGLGMAHLIAMTKHVGDITRVRTALYQVISRLPHMADVLPKALTGSSKRGLELARRLGSSVPNSPRSVYHQNQEQIRGFC